MTSTSRDIILALLQIAAVTLISLVAGSTFGIWQGYNPADFTDQTFLAVHQGSVRGLNVLLPALAMGAIVLALTGRRQRPALLLYILAIVLMAAGGFITRFENQPINALVMTWTATTMPTDWATIRDTWWSWHILRTLITISAEVVLIAAVLVHSRTRRAEN